jgi:hypothetical protein
MSRDAQRREQYHRGNTAGKNFCTPHGLGRLQIVLITGMGILTMPHVTTMY